MAGSLKVSKDTDGRAEIFCSIQGEGVYQGKPAVFLRLAHCNLRCAWCDTRYTWDWAGSDPAQQVMDMPIDDVRRDILRYQPKHLVVTGGEPLLQQHPLVPFLKGLKKEGFFVEIETNGTIVPGNDLAPLVDHWSVSPKLENSGNPRSLREIPECYAFFVASSSSHFKFVVQDEKDPDEVRGLVSRYGLPPERVILMPEARDIKQLITRGKWVVEMCKSHGYLFSTRLQVLLWGNQRGV